MYGLIIPKPWKLECSQVASPRGNQISEDGLGKRKPPPPKNITGQVRCPRARVPSGGEKFGQTQDPSNFPGGKLQIGNTSRKLGLKRNPDNILDPSFQKKSGRNRDRDKRLKKNGGILISTKCGCRYVTTVTTCAQNGGQRNFDPTHHGHLTRPVTRVW